MWNRPSSDTLASALISRLLLLLVFTGLLNCQPDDKLTGVAAGAAGRYVVTAYIVSGDTLFSVLPGATGYKPGINRVGVNNFTIEIDVVEPDQLTVRTSFWRNGVRSASSKEVSVRLTNYDYQFSLVKPNTSSVYEGSVGRFTGFFYERTTGSGLAIPLADSLVTPNQPTSQDVIVIAQPAR